METLGIRVDFAQNQFQYRLAHLQGRNELIIKAIGWKKGATPTVFDTTAGFGREAFLMAAVGCNVILFERHPTIAALLKEGLARGAEDPNLSSIVARMHLIETCAIGYLQNPSLAAPEIIYCDPMFEARTKSALVKKERQVLQAVVGPDLDAAELVQLAIKSASKRVVVKRPRLAAPLVDAPRMSFSARSHRFDVYHTAQLYPASCKT